MGRARVDILQFQDLPQVAGFPPYSALSPVMQQYVRLKAQAPDCLLFFRLGDFYELFGPDAERVGELLGLTVTSREKSADNPLPMAGVPHHSATGYLKRLLDAGIRVAIAEQMQDPATTKGMVERAIVRILSPGTLLEEDLLGAARGNYLALLAREGSTLALALLELSTATLLLQTTAGPADLTDTPALSAAVGTLLTEARRFGAVELLTPADLPLPVDLLQGFAHGTYLPHGLGAAWARERLAKQLGIPAIGALAIGQSEAACLAAAEALRVVERLEPAALPSLTRFTLLAPEEHCALDPITLRHLEILQNAATGKVKGSLLGLLQTTRTPMGARLLREVLARPLRKRPAIEARLDAVEELVAQALLRERLRDRLRLVRDLARIASRAQANLATPRDLLAAIDSLGVLPALRTDCAPLHAPLLRETAQRLGDHAALHAALAAALLPEAPPQFQPGRVIKPGYSTELDALRGLAQGAQGTLARLEAEERAASGLKVKIGHNRVHGYYLEIPKSQKAQAPAHWFGRQSLVNAERYVTQPLKDLESQVLGAEERAARLEQELFRALCSEVAAQAPELRATAEALAWLDLFAALAQAAAERQWVRPQTLDTPEIQLTDSRHPVLEELLGAHRFVPNDAAFEPETSRINILTGPNMAGKSTYMRQVALCVLLHQAGSFVPASGARLGCFDRILTRVGATDDLARGQSTFMVEMVETADILHQATPHSLVLLDEIGRGTSTYDGLALAWAIAEFLHNSPTCAPLVLFATHYHELTQLAEHYPAVCNWRITLQEKDGEILFLRRVTPGRAQKSYGVVVARLAGLPAEVIARAEGILEQLDHQKIDPTITAAQPSTRGKRTWPKTDETLPLFDTSPTEEPR